MQYIEAILEEILKYTPRGKDHDALFNLFPQLFGELQQLNPEDFAPRSRGVFMEVLRASKKWSTKTSFHDEHLVEAEQMAKDAIEVLGDHKQESGGTKRDFSFVIRHGIREIVARDYEDLERNLLPAGSWKCAVIACGSILEGVLFDVLTKTPAEVQATMASPKAPKKRYGVTWDITKDTFEDDWKLNDLIKVACDRKLIPYDDEKHIHLVLREYRNFVHPRLELTMNVALTHGHATTSKGTLDVILDHMTP